MGYGYTPLEEEEDALPIPFAQLRDELAAVDVGPQETDNDLPVDVADGPVEPPSPTAPPRAQPKGSVVSRDEELLKAQGRASKAAKRSNFGRAMDEISGAFGGYKPDTSYWDNLERQGGASVSNLEKRRASERLGKTDARQERLTEAQIAKLGRTTAPGGASEEQRELMRLRAEKLRADLDGDDTEGLEQFRTLIAKQLGLKPEDAARLSEKQLKALMSSDMREKMLKDRQAARTASAGAAKDKAAAKASAAETKGADKQKGFFLEGYELSPDAKPRDSDVTALRNAQASTNTINETVKELEAIYKTHGTSVLPSEVRARVEALTTDLQLAMKGPEQYALGVLAGPDMDLLEKTVPNPTGTKATVLDFFSGDQNILARYTALRAQSQRRFQNKARAFGYRQAGQSAPDIDLSKPAEKVRKAYSRSANKTFLLDASGKKVGEEEGDTRGR